MSDRISAWLLDKNVLRVALIGLAKLDLGQELAAGDLVCLELLRAAREGQILGCVSSELVNILNRFMHLPNVRVVLSTLVVFRGTRYFRRWARRLRAEGFSREDAKVIALATFGVNEGRTRFGIDAIVTGDLRLIHNFEQHLPRLERRLRAMTAQLQPPYRFATLPKIMTPEEAAESETRL